MSDVDLAHFARQGVSIRGLALDSRKVEPGDLFLAYPGETSDGRKHIAQAIERGAVAVLWERRGFRWDPAWRVLHLGVEDLRAKAGEIAAQFYGYPSRRLRVMGVTGTNGKSSVAHWLAEVRTALGHPTAVIGTLGHGLPGRLSPATHTTPDPVTLQRLLDEFVAQGLDGVAMEVSSHALDQGRVNGVEFVSATFTNLSRDHLDYHGSLENYGAAKANLFEWPSLEAVVLNFDDDFGRTLAAKVADRPVRLVGYGLTACDATLKAEIRQASLEGLGLSIVAAGQRAELTVRIPGRFNAYNLLAVLGTLIALGTPLEAAVGAMAGLAPIPGRMEVLDVPGRPRVIIDYAHTPDALEKLLLSVRELMVPGARSILVFGCGGNRDRGKRPLMGAVASRLADECVLTSDNPRHENPRAIIDEIARGMGANYHIVEDRAAAIHHAIGEAGPRDVVVIAGKGHETYQEIGHVRLPFSDREVAQRALAQTFGERTR